MAKPKLSLKTPLAPLSWVNISGRGKLRFEKEDNGDPENYQYTATVRITKEQADELNVKFKQFWKDNKPAGATTMKYELIKAETEKVLDKDGKPTYDEDDAPITKETGFYTFQAKTSTVWSDGKPNQVKVLRPNGDPLNLNGKGIGDGSTGVLHFNLGINAFKGNEGLNAFLTAVQLKKFVEYTGSDVEADDLGEAEGLEDLDMDDAVNAPSI